MACAAETLNPAGMLLFMLQMKRKFPCRPELNWADVVDETKKLLSCGVLSATPLSSARKLIGADDIVPVFKQLLIQLFPYRLYTVRHCNAG